MPTRVMQESSETLCQPSLSIPDAAPKPSLAKKTRSSPGRLVVEAPSTPAWEREVSESRQAQLQRSHSSVALAPRPGSFDDGAFEVQEAPLSGAAAVWEDIVEVGRPAESVSVPSTWPDLCLLARLPASSHAGVEKLSWMRQAPWLAGRPGPMSVSHLDND